MSVLWLQSAVNMSVITERYSSIHTEKAPKANSRKTSSKEQNFNILDIHQITAMGSHGVYMCTILFKKHWNINQCHLYSIKTICWGNKFLVLLYFACLRFKSLQHCHVEILKPDVKTHIFIPATLFEMPPNTHTCTQEERACQAAFCFGN